MQQHPRWIDVYIPPFPCVPFKGIPALFVLMFSASSQSKSCFSLFAFTLVFSTKGLMGLFISRNLASKFIPVLLPKKCHGCFLPKQLENMVCLVSRTGRQLQRYDKGCRLVVGCIPYRYRTTDVDETPNKELEVLVISCQNGHGMLFPKGGWEIDESMEQAASRETLEEAGVVGNVEKSLGKWRYKSKRQSTIHEGYMFPLHVTKQLEDWPEKNIRKRRWLSVAEAKEICPHSWMKEALDVLVGRQSQLQPKGDESSCTF